MPKLYAFWTYDQFPYCCGGEVTNMRADGAVETVGFGKGSWFQPFKVLPLKEGRAVMEKLQSLRGELWQAEEKLRKEFVDKRNKVLIVPK